MRKSALLKMKNETLLSSKTHKVDYKQITTIIYNKVTEKMASTKVLHNYS